MMLPQTVLPRAYFTDERGVGPTFPRCSLPKKRKKRVCAGDFRISWVGGLRANTDTPSPLSFPFGSCLSRKNREERTTPGGGMISLVGNNGAIAGTPLSSLLVTFRDSGEREIEIKQKKGATPFRGDKPKKAQ